MVTGGYQINIEEEEEAIDGKVPVAVQTTMHSLADHQITNLCYVGIERKGTKRVC